MSYKPFDLEAVKRGEPIIYWKGDYTYEARVICTDRKSEASVVTLLRLEHGEEIYYAINPKATNHCLYMKPLCIIEDKPVYVGDTLYYKKCGSTAEVIGIDCTKLIVKHKYFVNCYEEFDSLTWTKIKQKKSGWINIYTDGRTSRIYTTKREAMHESCKNTVDIIEIQWEE